MNNKNNETQFKKNGLMINKQILLSQIRKTYRLFLGEIHSLMIFSIFVGVFFLPYITFRIEELYIVPRVLIAFSLVIFGLIQVAYNWPYLKDTSFYLKQLKSTLTESKNESETSFLFIQAINAYLNSLLILHNKKKKKKKMTHMYSTRQIHKELNRVFDQNIIIYFIMGILIISYCIFLLFDYRNLLPNIQIYVSFIGLIIAYFFVIGISIKAKEKVNKWITGFLELKQWGRKLDNIDRKNELAL